MTSIVHFMADFETIATSPYPGLLTLGMVKFNPYQVDTPETLLQGLPENPAPTLALAFDVREQVDIYLREVDPETMAWWREQDPLARVAAFDAPDRLPFKEALHRLTAWVQSHCAAEETPEIWGYGAVSDPLWLHTAYADAGLPNPFGFRGFNCLRTVAKMAPQVSRPDYGQKHCALDDAIRQALWCQRIYAALGLTRN